ncbi:Phosphoenolpyruvate carboxylase [Cellulomonas flavigena DSM 20109]|uniref:Phosphoenolpyruvate carboxylase n=1 Tax=Cellulomonas flavigena (strain ATCC 482 / DSM 20109 / BCRC 11376 / JCM 18109 / NBRC 3775 / NCIMB 8073 / NRS 134) TaxID=446466 RepID=D5UGP1_CELFN|nr:phosphoenolpyruvate carboxylase [Cellulomonas flavigena]ADG75139.1 Phosphoenolpyruvate carboxylase [Cellulomonas flavigena DSM 20109]
MNQAEIGPDVPRGVVSHEVPELLRNDVRLLGELLGRVLREAGGEDLLADVERLRELAIASHSEPNGHALAEAEQLVAGFGHERAEQVARAFTCYFHLANLAEEYHRVRVLRDRESRLSPHELAPDDSLPAAYQQLVDEIGPDAARRRLHELEFRPVFTAHPTEARRRAVSRAIRRIAELVAERDTLHIGGTTLAENERRLLAEIDTLWRTSPLRAEKPTVLDEVATVLSIFDATLADVLPTVYRRLDDWLLEDEAGTTAPTVAPFARLGSWIGGDRDGNPNVTAEVTRAAAAMASEHALDALLVSARRTADGLTLDAAGTPPSTELSALWQRQRSLSDAITSRIADAAPNEPHRRALLGIVERVAATRRRDADLAYAGADELEADLLIVQESLRAAGAHRAAFGDLQRLVWQVQTFGFHLAELEVRQHSQVHEAALADIEAHGVDGELQPMTVEVLDTFRALGTVQRRLGVKAARRYIVSFTQSPEHLAAVYTLADLAFGGPEHAPVIDAIPLFETFADLQNSVDILEAALEHPRVQERLAANGRRVEVMLGYSDSSKDVGPLSATLALDDAQRRIAEWARRHDIVLTLFHGRGGALGRGGGPANRAVLAQPPGSVDGRFKLTEQGEVIFARYGDPDIAARHIEQVTAATLLADAPSVVQRNDTAAARFADLAARLDVASREHFHRLVRADGFPAWFAQVTPLEELGLLPIGSRPARRGLSVSSLDDLRAIPWVFSWSQARINLAGWYGLGTALEAVGDAEALRVAYAEWPLFATIIDNVEMSLAKTDERIAARYLALGDRDDLAQLVLDELRRTRTWVLAVTGSTGVLSRRRILGRAVQLRSPYVDALSLLQLRALRGLRTGEPNESADDLRRLLLLTVNGVAAGLQNTG